MNFEEFRRTGELSDITVIVDKTEFKLHTFPLFTKSDYFKKAVASTSPPYVVQLDNKFPGGAEVFNQLADYFYSIPISIDHKNIVPLCSAACFTECDELSTLLDKRLDEILLRTKAKYNLGIPLTLLEQCTGEYQQWAVKAHIVDKCLQCILESLARGTGLQLSKSDREIIVRLPLEWIIELITLCPKESKLAILSLVKHYITIRVLQQTSNSSSEGNEGEHQSTSTSVTKKDDTTGTTDDEKRRIIDEVVKALGDTVEEFPLVWLNAVYEKAVELKCESETILSSYITQAILNSTNLNNVTENIPDDIMTTLLERVNKHKEDHIKDPQVLTKVIHCYL
jgi:hypothetical protein